MPQMAPISWLILMIIFSITFLLFNMLNFFNTSPNLNKTFLKQMTNNNNNKISLFWKW